MYAILNIVKRDGEQIYKLESKYLRYIDHIDIMDCASLKKQTISDKEQIKAMRKDLIGLFCMSEQEVILNSCLKFVGFEPFHYQPLCDEKMWEYADDYDDILDWVCDGRYDDDFIKTNGIKVYYGAYEMDCATDFTLHEGLRDYSAFHPLLDADIAYDDKGHVIVPVLRSDVSWTINECILCTEDCSTCTGYCYDKEDFEFEEPSDHLNYEYTSLLGNMVYEVTDKARLSMFAYARDK